MKLFRLVESLIRLVAFLGVLAFCITTVEQGHLKLLWSSTRFRPELNEWVVLILKRYPGLMVMKITAGLTLLAGVEWVIGRVRSRRRPKVLRPDEPVEVLYLREFRSDQPPPGIQYKNHLPIADFMAMGTFDSKVCELFSFAGAITAVVRDEPGRLVPMGPDRVVCIPADTDWREAIRQMLHRAQLVLWVMGTSDSVINDSVLFELEAALAVVDRARLVLIVPKRTPHATWERVRSVLLASGLDAPEKLPWHTRVIHFRSDNNTVVLVEGEFALNEASTEVEKALGELALAGTARPGG